MAPKSSGEAKAGTVTEDLYSVLGCQRNATTQELKAAFRTHALLVHPDKVNQHGSGGKDKDTRDFSQIYSAFCTLRDPQQRAAYDAQTAAAAVPLKRRFSEAELRRRPASSSADESPEQLSSQQMVPADATSAAFRAEGIDVLLGALLALRTRRSEQERRLREWGLRVWADLSRRLGDLSRIATKEGAGTLMEQFRWHNESTDPMKKTGAFVAGGKGNAGLVRRHHGVNFIDGQFEAHVCQNNFLVRWRGRDWPTCVRAHELLVAVRVSLRQRLERCLTLAEAVLGALAEVAAQENGGFPLPFLFAASRDSVCGGRTTRLHSPWVPDARLALEATNLVQLVTARGAPSAAAVRVCHRQFQELAERASPCTTPHVRYQLACVIASLAPPHPQHTAPKTVPGSPKFSGKRPRAPGSLVLRPVKVQIVRRRLAWKQAPPPFCFDRKAILDVEDPGLLLDPPRVAKEELQAVKKDPPEEPHGAERLGAVKKQRLEPEDRFQNAVPPHGVVDDESQLKAPVSEEDVANPEADSPAKEGRKERKVERIGLPWFDAMASAAGLTQAQRDEELQALEDADRVQRYIRKVFLARLCSRRVRLEAELASVERQTADGAQEATSQSSSLPQEEGSAAQSLGDSAQDQQLVPSCDLGLRINNAVLTFLAPENWLHATPFLSLVELFCLSTTTSKSWADVLRCMPFVCQHFTFSNELFASRSRGPSVGRRLRSSPATMTALKANRLVGFLSSPRWAPYFQRLDLTTAPAVALHSPHLLEALARMPHLQSVRVPSQGWASTVHLRLFKDGMPSSCQIELVSVCQLASPLPAAWPPRKPEECSLVARYERVRTAGRPVSL
eukprot:TRINITY_DN28299_c0_g1_i2.p1 TRINITY_DN28299_c0_g1~~TRINITY_DN28299_c0_g1_i2.p1  ORF type:complete len:858 (+),score=121.54 TRINITY_DN28299_c0_g1_i2:42-2576(+)